MFVGFEYGHEPDGGGQKPDSQSCSGPIDDPSPPFAVAFDGDIKEAAIQRTRGKGISSFIFWLIKPAKGDKLASLEIGLIPVGPFQSQSFGVAQLELGRFDEHFNDRFC